MSYFWLLLLMLDIKHVMSSKERGILKPWVYDWYLYSKYLILSLTWQYWCLCIVKVPHGRFSVQVPEVDVLYDDN